MAQDLRANTEVKVRIGSFVDVGDGFTPETGITLGAADEAELLKHNGVATVNIAANTWAAIADCDGWYDLTLTAGNVDTEGNLTVVVQDDSVCLPVHVRFNVLSEAAWVSKYVAKDTGYMDVNAKAISDSTGAADNVEANIGNLDASVASRSSHNAAAVKTAIEAGGSKLDVLYADWLNGGRLDLLIDAIKVATDALDGRLTAVRAGYLDELSAANLPADIDTLKGYCDILDHATNGLANIKSLIDTVDTVVDAIKAVTDNLPDAGALNDLAAILTDTGTTLPATLATIAGYIDAEVAAILAAVDTEVAAIKAVTDLLPDAGALNDLATLEGRLTLLRAGYLDNLSAGAVALEATLLRTLGLVQENFYIDTTAFDASGNLLTARVRIYNLAANVGTGVGVVATYNVTATYVGSELATYEVKKA